MVARRVVVVWLRVDGAPWHTSGWLGLSNRHGYRGARYRLAVGRTLRNDLVSSSAGQHGPCQQIRWATADDAAGRDPVVPGHLPQYFRASVCCGLATICAFITVADDRRTTAKTRRSRLAAFG